jgi:hypothetical protein
MNTAPLDESRQSRADAQSITRGEPWTAQRDSPDQTISDRHTDWLVHDHYRDDALGSAFVLFGNIAQHTARLLHDRNGTPDLKVSYAKARQDGARSHSATEIRV